jgi:hypothetical protein
MSEDDPKIVDFAAKKAERLLREEEEHDPEMIMECPACGNRAFTIFTSSSDDPSFPGHDVVCTACDCVVDLTVD